VTVDRLAGGHHLRQMRMVDRPVGCHHFRSARLAEMAAGTDLTITDDLIALSEPAALDSQAWDSHLDLLRTGYPEWTFDAGYLDA
jgi:hypothetical protein